MDDRDVVVLYIAEMRAILPLVQRHIGTFGGDAAAEELPIAQRETARLATAMADLSSGFHAEDCAQLSNALARAFESRAEGSARVRLAAAAADIVTYLQLRMTMMSGRSRILAPDETERAWCQRLLTAMERASRPAPQAGASSAIAAQTAQTAQTPHAGQAMPGLPAAAPVTQPIPIPPDLAGEETWRAANLPSPAPFEYVERVTRPIPDPLDPLDPFAPGGELEPASGVPSSSNEALSADDVALLRSFHTSRLRLGPGPAPGITHPPSSDQAPLVSAQPPVVPGPPAASPSPPPTLGIGDAPVQRPTDAELDVIPADMKRVFVGETAEDLKALQQALLAHEEYPEDGEPLLTMSRLAHKIRGAASTLGFDVLAQLAFIYEDVLRAILSKQVATDARSTAALLQGLLLLQETLAAAQIEREPDAILVTQAEAIRDELRAGSLDAAAFTHTPGSPAGVGLRPTLAAESDLPGVAARPPTAEDGESSLRVDVRRLDDLMTHVSDLALNRASLAQARTDALQAQDDIDRSLARLAEVSVEIGDAAPFTARTPAGRRDPDAAAGAGAGPGANGAASDTGVGSSPSNRTVWDELELTRHDEWDHALRVLGEVAADLATTSRALRTTLTRLARISHEQEAIATEMQQDVMRIRLVPLNDLVPRLRIETRGLAAQLGKQITLSVRGEMTQIDRNVSDALAGPLLQLVRNAAVHAIEAPGERRECGKPESGSIWLYASYVGSEALIEIGDDGRGVNPHRLAASAVALGYLDSSEARELSQSEALDLMFRAGVSAFDRPQMVSGRGVGLDDVRNTIEGLKGSIHASSTPGQGTVFRIRVPISLSIVRALLVQSAGQHYAIPFSSVLRTVSLAPGDILPPPADAQGPGAQAGTHRRIRIEQTADGTMPGSAGMEEIPLIPLAELLGQEHAWRDQELALIVDLGRRRVALLVDGVYGDQEVVVKALAPHLRRRSVRGATVTPGGEVLLLLDVPSLAAGALDSDSLPLVRRSRPTPLLARTLAPRVLVVDDSISIRRALEAALTRAGFEVQVAQDGIEALDAMLAAPPQVVILDIEMPRLDGFELLSIMRDSPQLESVRVAMLTSRATDKHREHANHLGASAYLVKPCPNETLVETVRSLIEEPVRIS